MFLKLLLSYDPVPYVALVGDELHLVTRGPCALLAGAQARCAACLPGWASAACHGMWF